MSSSWDHYRTFLEILREGSLSGAARSLGLTQPTVGRHVDALEDAVGFQLFIRSRHGLQPTEAALALRPFAETLASTAQAMLRAASDHGRPDRGTVRIAASEVMGVEVLPTILADFHARSRGLELELVLSNALENLLRRDADIAVRQIEPAQEALVVKRLGVVPLGLFAHCRYLERWGTPRRAPELRKHSVIGFDRETVAIRKLLEQLPDEFELPRFALRADSDLAQLSAIRAGFGIGFCQVPIARKDPNLVRVLEEVELALGTWLVMHEDSRSSPRCRAVFDTLAAGLASHVDKPRSAARQTSG